MRTLALCGNAWRDEMSEKLKRATVPMCPECGGECEQQGEAVFDCRCGKSWSFPDWGYYAPDVSGVVAEMQEAIANGNGAHDGQLDRWINRLGGKP